MYAKRVYFKVPFFRRESTVYFCYVKRKMEYIQKACTHTQILLTFLERSGHDSGRLLRAEHTGLITWTITAWLPLPLTCRHLHGRTVQYTLYVHVPFTNMMTWYTLITNFSHLHYPICPFTSAVPPPYTLLNQSDSTQKHTYICIYCTQANKNRNTHTYKEIHINQQRKLTHTHPYLIA